MAKRTYKYRCFDCKEEQWINRMAFASVARPRCSKCGSLALDAVTKEATRKIRDGNIASNEQRRELKEKAIK